MSDREEAAAVPPPEMVVTDQQIAETLGSVLRESNASATINGVVQQIEAKLGVGLGHRMGFIRSQIYHFLHQQSQVQSFIMSQPHMQTPNFYAAPAVSHFPSNFTARQPPQEYGFRSQPQLLRPSPFPSQPLPPAESSQPPPVVKKPSAAVESVPTGKKRRGGPGGLNKLCGVSPELQTIVGQPTMPRTEIVKQLWAYIRKYNLQDPSNKRKIICNDELRLVFETDCTDMFKMNKLLAKHILPLDPAKQTAPDSKRLKTDEAEQTAPDSKRLKTDEESGSRTDDTVPIMVISEALAGFFGTDEREMSQAEVLRRTWEYIKDNQLEEPLNPAAIICDAKLKELIGCESISALGIPEMLARLHLSKKS